MTQLGLLEYQPPSPSPTATEQAQHLARVEGRLGSFILGWCQFRLQAGEPTFYLSQLADAVERQLGGAPDSASRILRQLRAHGQVDYTVERRLSRYTLRSVR